MALCKHDVFFQCRELTNSEKEKIQKYFQIKRKSGGGECGPVERVADDTYRITFLEQEAQQRVLHTKEHVIQMPPGCNLHISLTGNGTPADSSTESQQMPPGGEQPKVLKIDHYLLSYLKENPKAAHDLQQRLSPLCSSFQIFQEAEEIVVKKSTAQEALPQEKWEMQLEDVCFQLMQTYTCYYELDPKRLKILQDNPSFCSGNVCIYKEKEALAVVVGEKSEVDKLLQGLEAQQQVHKDSVVSEMQYTVVEEEFGREKRASFPHIKIIRQGSRTVEFEGPEAEVEAACSTLQELVKKIRQRRLQLPAPLLAFIISSRAMQAYQTRFQQSLRSPVMLEVGPDLVLSSLTSEALEEAAAALERDLTVETVVLEQAEAESPGMANLKENLDNALQQSNHNRTKVELSYGVPSQADPQMPVQIVGYRQDVEQLKQVLLNYKDNQADISDFLNLPNSFVVDHFPQVLELLGVQHDGLRLMPIHSPSTSVQFAGPRHLVQGFRRRLTSGLRSLVTKDFNVEGPGSRQYFRGEGKDNIALLERSHKVFIFLLPDETQIGAVFQQFHAAAQSIMGAFATPTISSPSRSLRAPVLQPQSQSLSPHLSALLHPSSSGNPSAAFTLMGLSEEDLSSACASLQKFYNSHCSQDVLSSEELAGISQTDIEMLTGRLSSLRVHVEVAGQGNGLVVRGLKDGVKEFTQGLLRQQMVERERRDLFAHVVWCIMGQRGDWERLPKEANQKLEKGDISGGVVDALGLQWHVNLTQMQATAMDSGRVTCLKRLENLPDFKVPLYWDSLDAGRALQVIPLTSSSAEYNRVKRHFKKTAKKTVLKIERVQNVHLRQAYEVLRQQLEGKNGQPVGAGEKTLYHGTTAQACQSIMESGFNRSFAGQNATAYGLGTYFAVNASYSANPIYSRPEADGTQLMFVARVLTGSYTLGQSDMKVPPSVSPQQPHIRFDSLVDNQQNPSMFVVFHDNQAYPDYLVTFK